jgi:hypothetical protein
MTRNERVNAVIEAEIKKIKAKGLEQAQKSAQRREQLDALTTARLLLSTSHHITSPRSMFSHLHKTIDAYNGFRENRI